jgi:protoporphyrinogen oxidase
LALGFARDLATAPFRSPRAPTFAEQVRAGPGPTIARHFYDPYARKLFGADPAELSGELFRRRVSASSPFAMAARVLRGSGGSRSFMSPRHGFGQISEAIADAAVAEGADLRLNTAATSVEVTDSGVRVSTDDDAIDAGIVLSSIPAPALVRLVGSRTPDAVRDAAASLSYRKAALVYLTLDTPQFSAFDAMYLPEPTTPVTRLSEPKNYRDNPDDPTETSVLCAEVPFSPGDRVDGLDDDALASWVIESLAATGLAVDPIASEVTRVEALYPIYTLDYAQRIATVERWFDDEIAQVVPFGRQALFAHDNTHHGLAMAKAAVAAIRRDGAFDHRMWESAKTGFSAHTVAD